LRLGGVPDLLFLETALTLIWIIQILKRQIVSKIAVFIEKVGIKIDDFRA